MISIIVQLRHQDNYCKENLVVYSIFACYNINKKNDEIINRRGEAHMKKWSWLLVLIAIFFINGIWTIAQVDETTSVSTRDIPHRDILENFGDVLGLWADEQELIDIEKLDIDCKIDDLLVETKTTTGNQQAYRTITLTLNMYLDTESNKDYLYVDYQEITRELQNTLRKSPYDKYIRRLNMDYYRADNSSFLFTESVEISGSTGRGGSTGVKQERKEHKAQTIAYKFADKLGYKEFDDGTGTMRQPEDSCRCSA